MQRKRGKGCGLQQVVFAGEMRSLMGEHKLTLFAVHIRR